MTGISGRIQPAMEETAQEILQAVENIEVQVEGTSGALVDMDGNRYVAKMAPSYSFDGLLDGITRNKPPTSNSVPYIYDADTHSIFYCSGQVVGKVNIKTKDYGSVTMNTTETLGLGIATASKNRIENVIQIYGNILYVFISGNMSSQSLANNIQKVFAINKNTLEIEKIYDMKAVIDPTIPYYYGMGAVLVTETDIIFIASMNVNNSAYSCHMYTVDKNTGVKRGYCQLITNKNNPNWCGTIYRIEDYLYTLVGDGANVRLVKISYNQKSGAISVVGYTGDTLPLGPNGVTRYYMFHESNILYIGDKLCALDITTLTILWQTTTAIYPIQKKDNILYVHNGNSIQEFDLTTRTLTTIIALGSKLEYIVPHYISLISDRTFEITDYLSYMATTGPLFVGYKYDLAYYLKKEGNQ